MTRTLDIRYFASLVDCTGLTAETVEVPDGIDVDGLWQQLVCLHPRLGRLGYRPLVACDLEYADWERSLSDVGEVAFLPPVSGG